MSDPSQAEQLRNRRVRWAIGLAVLAIYLATPDLLRIQTSESDHFPKLAKAFLAGHLAIPPSADPSFRTNELIPSPQGDGYYCAYPPLPAVLLMPLVAVFGSGATCQLVTRLLSAANVLIFDAAMSRLPARLNQPPLSLATRIGFDLLFALGTVTWHVAQVGGDWHLAHAITLGCALLALHEYLGPARPLMLGCWISAIVLTRPTAALGCMFVVLPIVRRKDIHSLLCIAAGPLAACALLGIYNAARFGSPIDFGYGRMILVGEGRALMDRFGQFHPHFIRQNCFWYFLAPPWPQARGGLPLGYDPHGLSFFLATPAMLYWIVALRRAWKEQLVRDFALSILVALVPLLLYFNTGYWQFGHRFSMDYLAAAMVLSIIGMSTRPSKLAWSLVGLSILVQTMGICVMRATRLPEWLTPIA